MNTTETNGNVCSELPYPTDPIRTWRRRRNVVVVISGIVITLLSTWALGPETITVLTSTETAEFDVRNEQSKTVSSKQSSIDIKLFQVRLWDAPPEPAQNEIAETEATPLPAPKLELVAIVHEAGEYMAAIYDANSDRLHVLRQGEHLGPMEITLVTSAHVDLRDNRQTYRLELLPRLRPLNAKGTLVEALEEMP